MLSREERDRISDIKDPQEQIQEILKSKDSRGWFSGSIYIIHTAREDKYTPEELAADIYIDDKGELEIWFDGELNFGDDDCVYSAYGKWRMLVARYWDHKEILEELKEVAKKVFGCKTVKLRTDVLRVDHGMGPSQNIISDYLRDTETTYEEFITDPSIIVYCDKHSTFCDLIDSGIINVANIKDIFDSGSFEIE